MGDNRSYAALDWVVGEIGETLKQARQALEAYVENPEDATRIRFCLTHIHQVHGSLQMVEFYGAALLAEEMENLAQSLMNKAVRNEEEAQEVLMRAILQMPVYLEKVKKQKKDSPAAVLPLLNDLRTVRGEALLTETKLFTPNLAPAHHVADKHAAGAMDPKQFGLIIAKLRQMYQYAAAGVIKDVNREENIGYLYKVFSRLRKLTQGTARQPLWDISLALLEGLENEAIESSASVKNLLRQIDKELNVMATEGATSLTGFANDELVKNLLYYIARADHQGKHIQRIKQAYNLKDALPEPEQAGGGDEEIIAPDLEAIQSVVAALKDELDAIKHALDISLTDRETADIKEALPIVKRVADTMAVLGIGDLRKQILAQGEMLEAAAEQEQVPDETLMQVAHKIIEIENSLDLMARGSHREDKSVEENLSLNALDQAQESVLRESRNGLEQAKDAIIEYIASQWDRDHLGNVPKHLQDIAGGLEMIPLRKPAAILQSCASYVREQLLDKDAEPDWNTLDTLADAIASVEYYLERITGDRDEEDEMLLTVAEESVQALGYPIAEGLRSPVSERSHSHADPASVIGKFGDVEEVELAPLPEEEADEGVLLPEFEATATSDETAIDGEFTEEITYDLDDPQLNDESVASTMAPADETEASAASEQVEVDDTEDDLIDDEIVEIFLEEAGEVIATINEFFPRWAEDFEDQEALTEFRRAFHTLKGSGRMVSANDVGELSWSVENMLNRVIDNTVKPNDGHVALITKVIAVLPEMVEAFKRRQPVPQPGYVEQLAGWAEALSKGQVPDGLMADQPSASEKAQSRWGRDADMELDDEDEAADSILWEIFGSEALTHLQVVEEYIAEMEESAPVFTPPSDPMQRALHTLKGSAHMADVTPIAELVTPLERFVKELRNYQVNIDADILQLIKDAVEYTHTVLKQIENQEPVEIPRLQQFLARVAELKERSVAPLIRQKEAEQSDQPRVDPKLLAIFMAEEMKLLLDADELLERWQTTGEMGEAELRPMITELETLEKGAEHANLPPMAILSHELCDTYNAAVENKIDISPAFFAALTRGHAELLDMVDAVAVGQNIKPASPETLDQLADFVNAADDVVSTIPTFGGSRTAEVVKGVEAGPTAQFDYDPEAKGDDDETATADHSSDEDSSEWSFTSDSAWEDDAGLEIELTDTDTSDDDATTVDYEPVATDADETVSEQTPTPTESASEEAVQEVDESEDTEEVDLEIFEIFVEEADELLEEIDEAVHEWENDWADTSHGESLKRSLHTLKGGARLAGLMGLGELAHEFETYLINKGDHIDPDESFFKKLHDYQDKLINGTEKVKARVAGHLPEGLEDVMAASDESVEAAIAEDVLIPEATATSDPATPTPTEEAEAKESGASILPFQPKAKPPAESGRGGGLPGGQQFGAPSAGGGPGSMAARRPSPQEMVKVSAELLEELVNLAGETSISRGRLEEQNSELVFAIDEMESTVNRLQEQLRRLDIETEAQMIFRQEQMEEAEEFDPLEMDRYSQLQQLSRSLMESASDLMDLTITLNDKTRGTETLLLQQSRINTDLQEGLMRSRMVPFSRLVPRLRRIVRQISTELGKHVSFELDNVEGEMDRSVLERMVAPLEHMLRNAVDHGIETVEERLKTGKPETGRIVLSLGREGGDVVMRLADDGRGLNLDRIRAKAIERGLMNEGAELSDHDIMQFILSAGFSTADKVTQISGRGVGMDVVHSEIKQLGGAMFIDSRWGQGTEFTIRLPFTVSVNRALMIQIGDDYYALPLNTIEGIVRVSPFELEHYYQDENARFEYAGENYRVRYLGTMLDVNNLPRLEGLSLPIPVVLVRTNEHAMAIQVDKLMGSREIVVKSLGPQFSAVEGLSGATVMGDGSVVVILDPLAMIRKEMALLAPGVQPLEAAPVLDTEEKLVQTVLVVDDSVTVRKVTSRFLEREGYEVMTAKDGADALMTLQDHIPDVMLLDIEMPRMDGFEVAKNMRSSSRLKDIPIIMITSRTGEKHRERALSLGVNRYLGKPYQEETLLNNIRELIGNPTES